MYVCNKVCVSFKEITTKRNTETEHYTKILFGICAIYLNYFFYYINKFLFKLQQI